jgi:transposase-like protein
MTISFARHQFPPAIIRHAVWLYMRFTLSYRDVEEALSRSRVLDKQKANAPRLVTPRARLRATRSSLLSEALGEYALMRDGIGC